MDDFEQHLANQSLKNPPNGWRDEILANARRVQVGVTASNDTGQERSTGLFQLLAGWLWPHPGAWASLAAAWMVIFALHNQVQTEIAREFEIVGYKGDPARVLVASEERRTAVEVFLATGDLQLAVTDRPKRYPLRNSVPPLMLFTS
jgi:hypothetical protein